MSSPFIPLLLENANGVSRSASNRAAGPPVAGNAFLPVVAPPAALATAQNHGGPAPLPEPCFEPSVTLQKDGERVTHIRIHCSCGQVVELACAY